METSTPVVPPTPRKSSPLDPRQTLQGMLDRLGLKTKVEQFTSGGSPLLYISTDDPARLIGKHGQTLSQLQFLLNRMLQRGNPDVPAVVLDCERYRERQRDEVLQKVIEAADKVRRWGDTVQIGPFSAFDRRIIHRHFESDRELEAISEDGDDGGRKKMTIRLREKPAAS